MDQEFDKFIKSKLDQRAFKPSASAWEDALALIENSPNKKVIPIYFRTRFWLALLAGFILTGLSFYALSYMFAPASTQTAMQDGLEINQDRQQSSTQETAIDLGRLKPNTTTNAQVGLSTINPSTNKLHYKPVKESSKPNNQRAFIQTPPTNNYDNAFNDDYSKSSNAIIVPSTEKELLNTNIIKRNVEEKLLSDNTDITESNSVAETSKQILEQLPTNFALVNELAPGFTAPTSPEVTGTLPTKLSVYGFAGLGSYGNPQNIGLQTSVGAYFDYELDEKWSVGFAPQLFAVKRFNNVLETDQTTAFAFGAIQQEYQLENTWQLGMEIPILIGYRFNTQKISLGPVARFNMNARGSLDRIQTTAFENSNARVNEGSIDPSLYQALNLGLQFNYTLNVGRKSKLVFYGSQYIDPFWRADSKKDLSIGVLFSRKLY